MTTVMSYWDPGCCARPPQQNSFSWEAANEVDAARGQCVRIDAADSLRKALHAGQRQQAGCPAIFEKALHGQTQRRSRGRDGARKIREARERYRLDEILRQADESSNLGGNACDRMRHMATRSPVHPKTRKRAAWLHATDNVRGARGPPRRLADDPREPSFSGTSY